MQIKAVYPEQRTLTTGERVDSIKVALETTAEDLQALQEGLSPYEGYTEPLEHYIALYRPPVDVERAVQEAVAEKDALIASVAVALPDDLAVQHKQLYPDYRVGMTLQPQERFRHDGALYRYIQPARDHVTQEDWPPATTPAVYSRVPEVGDPQPWVNGSSYDTGVLVTNRGKTWESQIGGNVWEPGAAGVYDNIWKEVI